MKLSPSTHAGNAYENMVRRGLVPGRHPAAICNEIQRAIDADRAALFATMPVPPDDMGSFDGLEAYADAIAEWARQAGHPLTYDGPVGPNNPRSISDEDLCATCVRCSYRPGELSGCTDGWPGHFDADGYCATCPRYYRTP